MTPLLIVLVVLVAAQTALLAFLLMRKPPAVDFSVPLQQLSSQSERLEKGLRDEFARNREEQSRVGRDLREEVAQKLDQMQQNNARKLDEMRQTVDEKLQGTLEKRLGESFKQVSERLEQVHRGLGEMQNLASGVGDLKRVLTNVKTRGTWGEVQLRGILEQMLLPSQFEANVKIRPKSPEIVEFAIRLPGQDDGETVWMPIDSKFPKEDYERILEAQDAADPEALKAARDALARSMKTFARTIRDLYVHPPHSTDFGVLFLPTEGLFAEVCQAPGLLDAIQRECRVTVAGPTTLAALLNSLQMGFQTLAIQKRSSEVWKVLGAVKTSFANFGETLDAVEKKLSEASNKILDARTKSRTIASKLKKVEELPAAQAAILIDIADDADPLES